MQKTEETTAVQVIVLPEEVKELALKISVEKQKEVQSILTQIFTGTENWEKQIDAIEVVDIYDNMSIQLADAARLNVKKARLVSEKLFDEKRSEIQARMIDDKTEDALWLKSKQIMQIKFKSIEEKAEFKANFVKRHEAEQRELKIQIRIEKVKQFNSELNRFEFENMSDEMFEIFINGMAKVEQEKKEAEAKIKAEQIAREKADTDAREKQRLENIRLQKLADEKEQQLAKERAENEKKLKAEREKAEKEKAEVERLAKIETEKQNAILKAEQEKASKLADELRAKQLEDARIKHEAEEKVKAEQLAKQKAEQKEKNASDKAKLMAFAKMLDEIKMPEVKSIESISIVNNVQGLIGKITTYIKANTNKL